MPVSDLDVLEILPTDGTRVPARVLCEALDLSADLLFRLMSRLHRAGLVRPDGTSYRLTWAGADRLRKRKEVRV